MNRRLPALLAAAAVAICISYTSGASALATKRCVALACAILVLAVSLVRGPPRRTGTNAAWLCAVAFLAWSALSAAWGAEGALLGLAVPLAGLALGSASVSLGVERAQRVATLAALGTGSALSVLVLASRLLGGRGFALHGGQGNPNWAGLMLAIALPLALSDPLLESWSERGRSTVRLGIGTAMAVALVATESRTGFVAALLGLSVVAFGRTRRSTWRPGALAIVLATALAFGTIATGDAESTRGAEQAWRGRLWIHDLTLSAALEHLPWGAGLGHFHTAFLVEQGRALAELSPPEAARRFQNATSGHQDFLEVALESGPLSLLLLASTLGLTFWRQFRLGFHGGAGCVAAFATASLADSPLRETAAPVLLSLVLAALPGERPSDAPARAHFALRLGLLAGAGLLLPRALGAFVADRARHAALDATPEDRLRLLRHAVNLDPVNAGLALELGAARVDFGQMQAALGDLRRAQRLAPDVANTVALGNALLLHGAWNEAAEAHGHAVRLNPGSFRARVGLAEALRRAGRFADAETHARVAVALLPGDARARELLDRIREQRTDSALGLPVDASR